MPTPTPLTSIVILTRNELEYTQRCVESIRRCTDEPYELVFVDNGSTDGTVDWLHRLPDAIVLANDHNAGFGGGCNQGIAASAGERILLLNNDIVATPGWLAALHRELDLAPDVGCVGPRSNHVGGEQIVSDVDYDVWSLEGLGPFAAAWRDDHAGLGHDAIRLIGFCMLFRREVLEQVGGFDLRYGIGNFEDDDISLRTAIAGWRLRIADDSFIHHYGSRTFVGEKIDYAATMRENFQRFTSRWNVLSSEVSPGGAYDAPAIVRRTAFDPVRHFAPIAATPDAGTIVEADGRTTTLLVCCDRHDAASTREQLAAAFAAIGPDDDVTVAVRIDPRDERAHALLDDAADHAGDGLPDVVLLELRDDDDLPAIRAADIVVVHGRGAWARAANVRWAGRRSVTVAELVRDGLPAPAPADRHAA